MRGEHVARHAEQRRSSRRSSRRRCRRRTTASCPRRRSGPCAIQPPVHDSAVAKRQPRSCSARPSFSASASRSRSVGVTRAPRVPPPRRARRARAYIKNGAPRRAAPHRSAARRAGAPRRRGAARSSGDGEQRAQRARHGRGIVARHEHAGLAVDDDVGHAADGARDDGHAGARGFEQREPETLAARRMHEQVEARHERGQDPRENPRARRGSPSRARASSARKRALERAAAEAQRP